MTPSFDKILQSLKRLPGLGYRSAERIALHLLLEKPERLDEVVTLLQETKDKIGQCEVCGNICEETQLCAICSHTGRHPEVICIVEQVPDLIALERSGAYKGVYHILHGKLSPLQGIGPEDLNIERLEKRLEQGGVEELILALSNDIEGEATCHYLQERIIGEREIKVSRIGFGIPSGAGVLYADPNTLKSALEARRDF